MGRQVSQMNFCRLQIKQKLKHCSLAAMSVREEKHCYGAAALVRVLH